MKQVLFILLLGVTCFASGQHVIHVQTEDGDPLPGVKFNALSVRDSDSSHFVRKIANVDGVIELPATRGEYAICMTYIGFDPYVDTLELRELSLVIMKQPQLIAEMVVTAQKEATSVEDAVQKVTVISADQIQRSGANNLMDILTYQTGVRIAQDNMLGSSMNLSGISGQNVKILVDGVPVIGRLNGNIDLSQINLNNVARIEVVEGPLSVNYGTNALAGTVNIITKKKAKKGVTIEVNPYYESIGNFNLSGIVSVSKKKHFLNLDGGRNFFDGWSSDDHFFELPKVRLADTNRVKTWKPKEQYFVGARYAYKSEKWNYAAYGKYFDELIINRGMPAAPYHETAFDDYYKTQRLDVGLTGEFSMKDSKLKVLAAYNDFKRTKNTYFKDLTTLNEVLSQTTGAQDTSRFNQFTGRMNFFSSLGEKVSYQLGVDINHSTGWGRRIDGGSKEIGDYAGFVSLDWKILDSLTIKPGVRYAFNTAYSTPVVPSLNVLYRHKRVSFRASVARGFRAPDIKELYMEFVDINHNIVGNQKLQAENSWNYTFNVNWMKLLKKNTLLKLEYGAYFNDIDNLITLGITDDNQYTYINVGEYSTIGQQLNVTYRSQRWQLNVNSTYIGRFNPDSKEQESVQSYSFSPELGTRLNYYIIPKRLQANVFYKYNGRLQSFYLNQNDEVNASIQSDYHILDVGLTTDLLKENQLRITIGAKNVLNVKQVNIIGQSQGVHSSSSNMNAGRGTSVFVALRYRFTLKRKKDEI